MGYDFDDVFEDDHGQTTFIIIACCMVGVFIAIVSTVCVCKRKGMCGGRGPMYQTPVVVTSQSHAPQGTSVVQGGYYPPMAPGSPPQGGIIYPPQAGYTPGHYPQHTPYPPAHAQQPIQPPQQPYPVHQNAPVVGVQPPAGYNENPPSYDQVQQDNSMYTKQPPYNPNYSGQQ
ncbi:hypothetical protein ACFFRR_011523 [Megaselia abdita]